MTKVVFTSEVEDSAKWLEGFVTHSDLFKDMTITKANFTATDGNEVAIAFEVDDIDRYMEILDSPATADAMDHDGIKRDTYKLFILDHNLDL